LLIVMGCVLPGFPVAGRSPPSAIRKAAFSPNPHAAPTAAAWMRNRRREVPRVEDKKLGRCVDRFAMDAA
jgi:hypothetical protein